MRNSKTFFIGLAFICFSTILKAHSVQVAYCVSCNGDLRLFFEHWHGDEDPFATTMTISFTINGVTTTQTAPPAGSIRGVSKANLPGCSSQILTAAGCPFKENTYNDWVWFDYTGLPFGVPITFTIISGNTEFTEDGCGMYPLNINFIIPNSAGSFPDVEYCSGVTVPKNSVYDGTTWTNDNASIGLPISGSGDVPTFIATNTSGVEINAIITITTVNSCLSSTTTYKITVKPIPTMNAVSNITSCELENIVPANFTSTMSGITYSWTNDNVNLGLSAASGNGNLPSFTAANSTPNPLVATISVISNFNTNSCPGLPRIFTITVNPTPIVNPFSDIISCNTQATLPINFSSQTISTTYSWTNDNTSIGLVSSGIGNINSFIATNPNPNSAIANIVLIPVAFGCVGSPFNFSIFVNPIPNVNPISNIVVCNTDNVPLTNFGSNSVGTSFSWTNDDNTIGIGSSGTGNFSFNANNLSTNPKIATISVFGTLNGCSGQSSQFTIKINPTPELDPLVDKFVCNAETISVNSFSSLTLGTTFSWTNNLSSIGLSSDGVGNIPQFIGINNLTTLVTATITVLPAANNCIGTPFPFNITINPTPIIDPISNIVVCNTDNVPLTSFTSALPGTLFSWTNTDSTIGIGSFGSGNFNLTANNLTTIPRISTISVFGTTNGCIGQAKQFTIRVNPTPIITPLTDKIICNTETFNSINFTSPTPGSTYDWLNDLPSIGLPSSGVGNIPGFVGLNSSNFPVTATIIVLPTANNCVGIPSQFTFTVNPTPRVDPLTAYVVCNYDYIDSTNFTSTTSGTTFTWKNNNIDIGLNSSGNKNVKSFYAVNKSLDPIFSTITVTPLANNCIGISSDYVITVNPSPLVKFTPTDISISELFPVINFENLTVGAESYLWLFGDNLTSIEVNPKHDYQNVPHGNYLVTLYATSPLGCVDSIMTTVKILEELIYYIPNTFTPNENELNNIFQPVFTSGFESTNYLLTIFDRWGEQIFESQDIQVGWNGTYGFKNGGKIVQNGMYTWKIVFTSSLDNKTKLLTGHVNLTR